MTRGEIVHASCTAVATIAAIASAYFAWNANSYSKKLNRPHLNIVVDLLESRDDNGIKLLNSGMTPARIHLYKMVEGLEIDQVDWAAKDLESLGWEYGNLVHHPFPKGNSISNGQEKPIVTVDRRIGQTDIAVLERLFSGMKVEICYCDMTDSDCWTYTWTYAERNSAVRDESPYPQCTI